MAAAVKVVLVQVHVKLMYLLFRDFPTLFRSGRSEYQSLRCVNAIDLQEIPSSSEWRETIFYFQLWETCRFYMDDLIVIGCSIKHHLESLENVFKICRKYNLKLNPEKCEFFRPEVTFLGHSCTEHGIRPDNKKLHSIEKYPRPKDKEETRRFADTKTN